jgi:predicted amidohydrolase
MRAGFIQFSPQFGKVDANIDKALAMLEKADAELIILPELFNTGYLFVSRDEAMAMAEEIPAGKTIKALSSIAQKKKIHIVAGIVESAGENLYNSALLIAGWSITMIWLKLLPEIFNNNKIIFLHA